MTLAGKIALVTGATSGIGLETARQLAGMGARVLVHGRTDARASQAAHDVGTHGDSVAVWGDYERLQDVRDLADQVSTHADKVDVLINNAGVFSNERTETTDGHELTFQVNHLAPFLLTNLLLPSLCAAPQGRVLTVSSVAHFRGQPALDDLESTKDWSGYGAYATSKLHNVMFALELAQRLRCEGATSNALHPGTVSTKLLATGFPSATGAPLANGASTSVYLASDPELASVTGAYFVERRQAHASPKARDPELRRALWDASAAMVGLPASGA